MVPHERVQQRTVDVPISQILEDTVEMNRLAPNERMPQILKETARASWPRGTDEPVSSQHSMGAEGLACFGTSGALSSGESAQA